MVNAVRVIPENTEILSLWGKVCETLYCFIGICDAVRVGVHWYAPDTLDGLVFGNELLDRKVGEELSFKINDHRYNYTVKEIKLAKI